MELKHETFTLVDGMTITISLHSEGLILLYNESTSNQIDAYHFNVVVDSKDGELRLRVYDRTNKKNYASLLFDLSEEKRLRAFNDEVSQLLIAGGK